MRLSAGDIATLVGGELIGDETAMISGLDGVEHAGESDLTLIAHPKYLPAWQSSKARVALVSRAVEGAAMEGRTIIVVDDAEVSMIRALESAAPPPDLPEVGVHETASVDSTATIGDGVRIGAHVSVGARVSIGEGVALCSGVHIYAGSEIGDGTVVHANVVIRERTRVGRGVILNQNVSIGADGFGYRPAPDGSGLLKVPHLGGVLIEDGVEIGANSCVDRGKFGDTIVGAGTKIDNLVQIGHNCRIGRCCIIAAHSGLAGSVKLGDGVVLAGAVGVTDHVTIGSGVTVGAGSGVMHDIPAGETWLGSPATDSKATLRQWAAVRKLPKVLRSISESPRTAAD